LITLGNSCGHNNTPFAEKFLNKNSPESKQRYVQEFERVGWCHCYKPAANRTLMEAAYMLRQTEEYVKKGRKLPPSWALN
jgi:hypothetical protein